jgi:hypothetical protein
MLPSILERQMCNRLTRESQIAQLSRTSRYGWPEAVWLNLERMKGLFEECGWQLMMMLERMKGPFEEHGFQLMTARYP